MSTVTESMSSSSHLHGQQGLLALHVGPSRGTWGTQARGRGEGAPWTPPGMVCTWPVAPLAFTTNGRGHFVGQTRTFKAKSKNN